MRLNSRVICQSQSRNSRQRGGFPRRPDRHRFAYLLVFHTWNLPDMPRTRLRPFPDRYCLSSGAVMLPAHQLAERGCSSTPPSKLGYHHFVTRRDLLGAIPLLAADMHGATTMPGPFDGAVGANWARFRATGFADSVCGVVF